MKYKEFVSWCNERACDGCWSSYAAMTCINIMGELNKLPFWRRERVWQKKYKEDVSKIIINPIEKKIKEYKEEIC